MQNLKNKSNPVNENFDRELGLKELLSTSLIDELAKEIQEIVPVSILVLFANGAPYYTSEEFLTDDLEIVKSILRQEKVDKTRVVKSDKRELALFPIIHELEITGYLIFGHKKDSPQTSCLIFSLGSLLLKSFNQVIVYRYKTLLTTGIHKHVIVDSYAQLMEKATLLQKSEQKYKLLAENLEAEVKKQTEKIRITQVQLMEQEKLAAIGRLAAGVAHEINNPIGFIKSNLGTMNEYMADVCKLIQAYCNLEKVFHAFRGKETLEKKGLQEIHGIEELKKDINFDFILCDLKNIVEESKEGSERIEKIVSSLKDFSSIDTPDKAEADLHTCIDSTLNTLTNIFRGKAKIVKHYENLPIVPCYRGKLNQVFMNLLINAAQSIKDRGTITISTKTIQVNGIDDFAQVQIKDTGVGIPLENLCRVFEPFFTTRDVGEGMGLGLSTAYDIMKVHGGDLSVESAPGKGSTFTIKIPIKIKEENIPCPN